MTAPNDIRFAGYRVQDAAAVRALHEQAWRDLAGPFHTPEQVQAHILLIRDPGYAAALATNNLTLAWHKDGRLLGSAGWCDVPDAPDAARIRKVFIDPATAGSGLGRRLVSHVEAAARAAGRRRLTVRSNANAEGFYAALGYRPISRGIMPAPGADLPVVFMEKSA